MSNPTYFLGTTRDLLDKAHSLSWRTRDMRRYQYDRDAAARELVELIPQLLETFEDVILCSDRLEIVAEAAEKVESLMMISPAEKRWGALSKPLQNLREAIIKLDDVR